MRKNLVLLGMMGVGKSTIGKIVAKKQDLKFIDTDINIEKKRSMKISEIFENKGEKYFRFLEEKEVLDIKDEEELFDTEYIEPKYNNNEDGEIKIEDITE